MYELVDMAIQTVKRISAELRPGVLDDLGLAAAIEWQAGEFEKLTEIKNECRSPCQCNQGQSELERKQIFDPKAFGPIGIRERARFWGDEVKISGTPGKGTTVAVSIPLINEENPDAENINCR